MTARAIGVHTGHAGVRTEVRREDEVIGLKSVMYSAVQRMYCRDLLKIEVQYSF